VRELPASPIQEGSLLLEMDMNSALQAYERLWALRGASPPKEKIGYGGERFRLPPRTQGNCPR